jgi:hypothetical protein
MITVEVDNREVMANLNRLEMMLGKPLETLFRQSSRRVCVNLSRTIAPFGFDKSAHDSGLAAVQKDYRTSTKVVDRGYMDAVLNRTKGKKKNIDLVFNLAGTDTQYPIKWDQISESGMAIKRNHADQRNRKGRVNRRQYPVPMVTTEEGIQKGMKTALRRVGLAKYAYSMAARSLGGTRGIPAWVKKSRGSKTAGAGTAVLRKARAGYTVEIDNRLPYASVILSKTGEMDSMKREADFLAQEVKRNIDRRWKK